MEFCVKFKNQLPPIFQQKQIDMVKVDIVLAVGHVDPIFFARTESKIKLFLWASYYFTD